MSSSAGVIGGAPYASHVSYAYFLLAHSCKKDANECWSMCVSVNTGVNAYAGLNDGAEDYLRSAHCIVQLLGTTLQ